MGHSMGGNTVLNALCRASGVRGAILLAPCDISVLLESKTAEQRTDLFASNGSEVLNYDGNQALVDNVMENACWMNFQAVAPRLPECPLMIVTASKDPICPRIAMVDPLQAKLNERGYAAPIVCREYFAQHSLMGIRATLTKDLAAFIENTLEG